MLPALIILMALVLVGVTASTADITVLNQPASEGRRITPAGSLVMDITTRQPAVGALPVKFARSPDGGGPDGLGRYLLAINSGFGVQFNSATNRAQQSLAVIDLNLKPQPACIQNVYFPSPQSVNVGVAFVPEPSADGSYALYVSGGFENKIWIFRFDARGRSNPITPASPGPATTVKAPFIDTSGFAHMAAAPNYNDNRSPVYPTGIALSPDGDTLYTANNLGDSLGIISNLRGERRFTRVDLRRENPDQFIYPYEVLALPDATRRNTAKIYVSCWNDASLAVIDAQKGERVATRIAVARHPTAMIFNREHTRLYVVNSNADNVSVIDTASDREIERIDVRLAEGAPIGASPEGLALSRDGGTLYVANAHSNSVAVINLSAQARGGERGAKKGKEREVSARSAVRGLIPTGQYPSAIAVAGGIIYVGNGKGTGVENSSLVVDNSGRAPNAANDRFPIGAGRGVGRGGQYSVSLVIGNISAVPAPGERALARYTQQVMRNNNLLGPQRAKLFKGSSPIKHVIYVIKENRTYDQILGDVERAGNGQPADGDASLAIFGAGEAARRETGPPQNITPNHRALALRFGLLDRFFVNSEASPDGHNWSTAAFSNDYVDKAYRWNYSNRGRTYDFEGFNRLPSGGPQTSAPAGAVSADDIANFMRRYVPYLNDSRDVAEPETLYLWDAAARKGLSYRNYGEFIGTISEADVAALNTRRQKTYPDISPTVKTLPTKKSLENHHSPTFRNYDLYTPDAMITESYRAAKASAALDPVIAPDHADVRFRGTSRLAAWLGEFRGWVADLEAGRPDRMPQFMMVRFPSNHTSGLQPGMPTPQFAVADNDYAIGRLVEAVSHTPYWKNTAIFILEDDAQDGPDHVDAHRSPALVISAYNRPGTLVHEFHNTVSLIRTMEILLGLEPMNQLDETAAPIDIFRDEADLRSYKSLLPDVALDNLINSAPSVATHPEALYWIKRTAEQDLAHADMADPRVLNEIIWYSVRGPRQPMPEIARLPLFDAMRAGIVEEDDEEEERERERMGAGRRDHDVDDE